MRPLILLTNDDGIMSPGLVAMADAIKDLAELLIVAPNAQQTTMGRAFPRTENLGVIKKVNILCNNTILRGYSVVGSPAYAVSHGLLEITKRKPDLCISGVNYGENLGTNIACSGTIGAVLEANTYGIPGIAFSLESKLETQRSSEYSEKNWSGVKRIIRYWTEKSLEEGMINGASMLNINIPESIPDPENFCYTRQSNQNYFEFSKPVQRNWDKPYEIPTEIYFNKSVLEEDSDIYVMCVKHMISVTPMVHNLTA